MKLKDGIEWIRTHKVKTTLVFTLCVMLMAYVFALPSDPFEGTSYSTVVTSSEGELLGARIAEDGQWRFPPSETIPEKFAVCLIEFEDQYFRYHPGINPLSVFRAICDNIAQGRTVSGASTITMQLIRMSRRKERTIWQKCIEAVLATRAEWRYSKDEILALYASHAPFGGNIIGLEAAAWRYFGRSASELSWGEAATLAVLPNSPSSIHPGKNRDALKAKRDRLLHRLRDNGQIDSVTCMLACEESLPDSPLPLPQHASHLVSNVHVASSGTAVRTSIDISLQKAVEDITDRWNSQYATNGMNDLAAVVLDVYSGEALAYVGNANARTRRHGSQVDIASSARSTGSLLKPVLYCALMQEGEILPYTLLPDTPININGFTPQNFDLKFEGAIRASRALSRSLNIPAVHMLRQFGVQKFHTILTDAGMTTLTRAAEDYGLSLILGGGEGRLTEMTRMYAAMSAYYQDIIWEDMPKNWPLTDKMALYYTFDALKDVSRPDEMDWKMVRSLRKVAWKTGTSYGFRDGWAIGVSPQYAVGVWVGNAGGEGSPGLIGAQTAGPVMFDIFNILDSDSWFEHPLPEKYISAEICPASGHLKGPDCPGCDTLILPVNALRSSQCPYHKAVGDQTYFILPPAMEWYYRQHHPEYTPPPTGLSLTDSNPMEFIYPENGAKIKIPDMLDGSPGKIVFNLAHYDTDAEIFWHMDNSFIGTTKNIHQMSVRPDEGRHTMTVVDNKGNSLSVGFRCYLTENL